MGNTEGEDEIADRRAFVRRLRDEPEVHRVTFSRDGFRTIVVALEPATDFRDRWGRTATRLGYTAERVAPDESRPGRPGDVWVLELAASEGPTDGSTLAISLRRLGVRLRRTLGNLFSGRRGR
jgi:hypothetical protein